MLILCSFLLHQFFQIYTGPFKGGLAFVNTDTSKSPGVTIPLQLFPKQTRVKWSTACLLRGWLHFGKLYLESINSLRLLGTPGKGEASPLF